MLALAIKLPLRLLFLRSKDPYFQNVSGAPPLDPPPLSNTRPPLGEKHGYASDPMSTVLLSSVSLLSMCQEVINY
jgi:hypothetical protein